MTAMDGYFDAEDEYTREKCPTSNEREMVVLAVSRLDEMKDFVADLLAHEFQHMIHWNNDPREATWVDEACSAYAATLYQHFPFTVEFFMKNPDRCLIDWDDTIEWSNYGHVFLFLNYVLKNCSRGDEGRRRVIKALVASRKTSVSGLEEALGQADIPLPFAELFRSFYSACYLGATPDTQSGRLGFDPFVYQGLETLKPSALKPLKTFPSPKAKIKGKLKMWSSQAFRFHLSSARGASFAVSFAGQSFEAKRGRNFFDVGVLFLDRKGGTAPHLSWLDIRDNAGEEAIKVPEGHFDEILAIVCNRGPGKLPANEKRWPLIPFVLEIGTTPDVEAASERFEELHRNP